MPYIKKEKRDLIIQKPDKDLGPIVDPGHIDCAGDLNFTITWLIKRYLEKKGESYQVFNDVMGALEGAKLEMYRRQLAKVEDSKIEENGDVE